MIAQIFRRLKFRPHDLITLQLYNEQTFYRTFERDLAYCRNEAVVKFKLI
jgi:hypothetical protein